MTAEDDGLVRIGIIGLGNIGGYHAEFLGDVGDADLVAGLDIDAAARRSFAEEYDVETYEDHAELFSTVDAVIVTTPNRFHEEYAVAALRRASTSSWRSRSHTRSRAPNGSSRPPTPPMRSAWSASTTAFRTRSRF